MTAPSVLMVDFDGTIAETAAANYAAYAAALAEAGVSIERASFDALAAGRNWRQFLPGMLRSGGSAADAAHVARRKSELYPRHFDSIAINHALMALIRGFRPAGRVALVTTASRRNLHAILDHFDLTRHFDVIVTGDDVERHKPAPDAYALAAAKLGCTPAECLVIEDSDIGVAAGRAFGALVLRVAM